MLKLVTAENWAIGVSIPLLLYMAKNLLMQLNQSAGYTDKEIQATLDQVSTEKELTNASVTAQRDGERNLPNHG